MIIQIPITNGLNKTKGTEKAPKIIWDSLNTSRERIIKPPINQDDLSEAQQQISEISKKYSNKKPLFLGGDHSISYPLVKEFIKKNPNIKLIVLDAHPDLMKPMEEPTHEEWLRAIIERTKINPKNILLVGLRSASANIDSREIEFSKKRGIKIILSEDLESRHDEIKEFANKPFYLSIDIDAFDEKDAKATGYPEKNGPKKKTLIKIIKKLSNSENNQAIDVVEYNPTKDKDKKTLNLIKEILEDSNES